MAELCELINIGKIMEKRLAAVGIHTTQELLSLGSRQAFARLHLLEGDT